MQSTDFTGATAPCNGCKKRFLGCHDRCDEYKAYKEEAARIKEKKYMYYRIQNLVEGKKIENRIKKKRRK